MIKLTALTSADYRSVPWKNGGGVTTDIASDGDVWRFSRTPITAPGPFSDYAGFDRRQVLITGRGLVLQTPDGEIDVRRPFRPVRFAGETPITSRLEAGPVEVLNLMGERARVRLELTVLEAGETRRLGRGLHIAYCPEGEARLQLGNENHSLTADRALRIEDAEGSALSCSAGRVVVGSILCGLQ
jgi:uncharacterized protein